MKILLDIALVLVIGGCVYFAICVAYAAGYIAGSEETIETINKRARLTTEAKRAGYENPQNT